MRLGTKFNEVLYRLTGRCLVKVPPFRLQRSSDLKRLLRSDLKHEVYGVWSDATVSRCTNATKDVEGDFVEMGVASGRTFHRLAKIAHSQGKMAHAIDSFVGMAEPGEHDRKIGEGGAHRKGKFSVGGSEGFVQIMEKHAVPRDTYKTWEGFIPDVFQAIPEDLTFSLAILDVDHYQPTHDGLRWLWPRINHGGYLLLDDCGFFWDRESTRAIKEFLCNTNGFWVISYYNNQLILRKTGD